MKRQMKGLKRKSIGKMIAVDFFSGCGGLSIGLKRAGFDVLAAVEINPVAADTYRKNHPTTQLLEKDIRKVTATEIRNICGNQQISLVAGCAPCQGFCSLTAKNQKEDPRNELLLHMLKLIKALRPKAVMMENVPGLEIRGEKIFKQFVSGLERLGYKIEYRVLQMADYGVPQSRRRLVLFAGLGFEIPLPKPTHAKKPTKSAHIKSWIKLKDVIGGMPKPTSLKDAHASGGPRKYKWHVVSDLQPQVIRRLKAAIPGQTWIGLKESIRPECHKNGYKGFSNTYGRMAWNQTSVTITGGFTSPCRGRFGHPNKTRTTISVFEGALIQTFPRNYIFTTDYMDAAMDMIGNAVPPHFADVAGRNIRNALKKRYEQVAAK